jgi:general secretion pathway protein M
MTPSPTMMRFNQAISDFWNARNERERKQLLLMVSVILLALVYMLLIEPAYVGREQLGKSLPTLRQQATELQALATQATTLSRETPPPPPPMTKETIEASMTRAGLPPQTVAIAGTDLAKVQLSGVSFASMVAWLDEMKKAARISVTEASITAQAQSDTVNATLTLRQQKSE